MQLALHLTYHMIFYLPKSFTFGRKDPVFVMSGVDNLNIEFFRDDVDSWYLIIPSAVRDHQAIRVCQIFFVQEKTDSLNKATFSLHIFNNKKKL